MQKSEADHLKPFPRMWQGRIKRELIEFYKDPPSGIFLVSDESNFALIHAIILGPPGTPYEGGFFYFIIKYPSDYPMVPPLVEIKTTGNKRVRFNPNLYACGRVCLSILGTWVGPKWSPALTVSSVLLSIQSLMNDHPYYNEPGYSPLKESNLHLSEKYNEFVRHETIRVAVCDMVTGSSIDTVGCPQELISFMQKTFLELYDNYHTSVKEKLHMNGEMYDPFAFTEEDEFNKFMYGELQLRLESLKTKIELKRPLKEEYESVLRKNLEDYSKDETLRPKNILQEDWDEPIEELDFIDYSEDEDVDTKC